MKATKGILQINEIQISKKSKGANDSTIIISAIVISAMIGIAMILDVLHLI